MNFSIVVAPDCSARLPRFHRNWHFLIRIGTWRLGKRGARWQLSGLESPVLLGGCPTARSTPTENCRHIFAVQPKEFSAPPSRVSRGHTSAQRSISDEKTAVGEALLLRSGWADALPHHKRKPRRKRAQRKSEPDGRRPSSGRRLPGRQVGLNVPFILAGAPPLVEARLRKSLFLDVKQRSELIEEGRKAETECRVAQRNF